jgi:hypothetical protein
VYSKKKKRILLIELIVPWETNFPKDHTIKINRYYELTNKLISNNYLVSFYAVEVRARGIPTKSLYNLFKNLGFTNGCY